MVYVVMISSLTCVSGNPAISNTIPMVVNPPLPVNVTIVVDHNDICEGTNVTFTATPFNGGPTPVYQWYRNTVPVGSGQQTYTCIPANGDQFYVVMTSTLPCVSGNPATSNILSMVVYPIPETPTVTVSGQLLQSSSPTGNQWYFDGNIIPGATNQTYFATQTGSYWTEVTISGCTSDTSNHIYLVLVGIEENPESNNFIVYPVPNDGHFTVSISLHSEESFTIEVYNYLGKRLYKNCDIPVKSRYEKTVDLRPLAAGIYSVVFNNKEIKIVKRIIVHNK
jgi:hypothetical protein